MRCYHRPTAWLLAAVLCFGSLTPPSSHGFDYLKNIFKGPGPVAGKDPSVERLAQEIDWLERHIEQYGSVVCKQPDVWGQARLTKHREEYEELMAAQKDQFELYINGTIARSDQAFFSNAFALQAAVSGRQATVLNPVTGARSALSQSDVTNLTTAVTNQIPAPVVVTNPAPNTSQQSSTIFATSPLQLSLSTQFTGFATNGIALEPTLALDQRSRYIQHLHELRRINEGDDTADSPGYALNLVRIPVSILPGRATREGYGAEVTVTLTPYLSDVLLPTTFRNLVINDLVDQLGLPITHLCDSDLTARRLEQKKSKLKQEQAQKLAQLEQISKAAKERALALYNGINDELQPLVATKLKDTKWNTLKTSILGQGLAAQMLVFDDTSTSTNNTRSAIRDQFDTFVKNNPHLTFTTTTAKTQLQETLGYVPATLEEARNQAQVAEKQAAQADASKQSESSRLEQEIADLEDQIKNIGQTAAGANIAIGSTSRSRRASNPIPPTQLTEVFGEAELKAVKESFRNSYQGINVRWNGYWNDHVHLPDVQRFLQEELDAAYGLYARLPDEFLINLITGGQLAERLRQGDLTGVGCLRMQFAEAMKDPRNVGQSKIEQTPPPFEPIVTPQPSADCPKAQPDDCVLALAWAVVVEAALLSDRLVNDIHAAASAKGCPCNGLGEHGFYLPNPSPEARQVFNEYVRCRWPIHVFALDPVTQDQNLADAFSKRRELQLAASLAFVSGQISAANLSRFVRRLESDYETVTLNRTVVGFSHGEDTFGWRFSPRFQTPPPTSGTIRTFGETLFGSPSKDCDLLHRQIEPGMRECVALVIMPSFVPYLTMDVRTNWCRLNHHHGWLPTRHNTEPAMSDVMKLSRSIQSMHQTAAHICDAGMYRNGEVDRLLRRVQQLDRELPLQSAQVQVPIENTLGGFEMFSNGLTDLAPELDGWYGGPGVIRNAPTTLFLVGDHFSVHHTQIVAGDAEVTQKQMLSRQIMQVTIPGGVAINTIDGEDYVDVHVATPYGVTSHLHIPVYPPTSESGGAPATPILGWQPEAITCVCKSGKVGDNDRLVVSHFEIPAPGSLKLSVEKKGLPFQSTAKLNFAVSKGDQFLRGFEIDAIPFDGSDGALHISDGKMQELVDKLTTAINVYVNELTTDKSPENVRVLPQAVVNGVHVDFTTSSLNVNLRKQ